MSTPSKEEDLFPSPKSSDEHGEMYTESLNSPTYGGGLPSDGSHLSIDPEERERQMQEWKEELNKVEEEIVTLRQVLTTKVREAAELKRKMGITPFQEFKHDMQTGINQIKGSNTYQKINEKITQTSAYVKTNETLTQINDKITHTTAYQKTSAVVKTASEKTSSAISTIGSSMSRKLGDIRNSQTFRSMEERVGSTYANVKTSRSIENLKDKLSKVAGSRSDEQLDATQEDGAVPGEEATATSPSDTKLPEEKVPL